MLKILLPLTILFHFHIHAKSMLVDPSAPLSDPDLLEEFFKNTLQIIRESPHKINEINEEGYTLLHQALLNQAYIENALSHTKSPDTKNRDVFNSSVEIIRILLNKGADPNIPFPENENASKTEDKAPHFLFKVAAIKSIPLFPLHIIELLFEHGLNAEVRDERGNTPLMRLITLHYSWRKIPEYRRRLIHWVAEHTHNIDAQNKNKETAMHLAVLFKDIETARLLAKHGLKLNIQNNRGHTPEEVLTSMIGEFSFFDRKWTKIIKFLREEKKKLQKSHFANGSAASNRKKNSFVSYCERMFKKQK